LTEAEVVNDYIDVMDLGDMSIDLAVASCMYRIKQNPEIYVKVMEELKTHGVDEAIQSKTLKMPMMAKCEYLNYVIKESLRIDPPTITSHPYEAFKDATI
jgi:cytochrome P450